MSNQTDFVIENGYLESYKGSDAHVDIPEGVWQISGLAFHQANVTSLSLPASLERAPLFAFGMEKVHTITVAEGNPRFKSVDGVVYSADGTVLILCPPARTGEFRVPEGVVKAGYDAMSKSKMTALFLPASVEEAPGFSPDDVTSITVDEANPRFKSVDGVLYDFAMETLLCYPSGREGEFYVPDGVKRVILDSLANVKSRNYHIHVGADMTVEIRWAELIENNAHITIYAPAGSAAERVARRCNCNFVAEGEPVAEDDSSERKERSFKDWRLVFSFSTRSKGLNITKYVRGSRVVYLPDKMGKAEVATIAKDAFPSDVAVLCSKKIFNKLAPDNRHATIHAYLTDPALFLEDEQAYLLDYLKKHRDIYLEKYILAEDYPALEACFAVMPKVKTLMEECLALTERHGEQQVNAFLLQLNQK